MTWKEVNKNTPCPLCGETDWCNLSPDNSVVQCGRTDKINPPGGWEHLKDGSDGRPILRKINDNSFSREITQTKLSETKILEREEDSKVRDFLANKRGKNIPDNSQITKTIYLYSPEQRIIRYDWTDPAKEKGRDKTFVQEHFDKSQNRWIPGKGEYPWLGYNETESLENAKGKELFLLEGEKNVDQAISLGLPACTLQGSNWSDKEIKSLVQKVKDSGVERIIFWADGDDVGQRKAEKVKKACDELQMPVKIISNKDLIHGAKEKDDIEEAIAQLGEKKVIPLLQEIDDNCQQEDPFRQDLQKQEQEYEILMRQVNHIFDNYPNISTQRYLLHKLAASKKLSLKQLIELFQLREADQDEFEPISAQELYRSAIPEIQWVIPGMVARKLTYLLAADGGTGKTLLAWALAYLALSNGYKVLFISADDPPAITTKRLQKHQLDSENLFIETRFSLHQLGKLKSWVKDRGIDFVVIDSLTSCSLLSEFGENDQGYAFPLYECGRIADSHNLAILVIHHVSKQSGTSRGATAIRNAVSESWLLKKNSKNERLRELIVDKYRIEIAKSKRFFTFDSSGLLSETDPPKEEAPSKEPSAADQIDGLLEDGQMRSAKQIAQELGLSKSTVSSALKRMVELGEIVLKRRALDDGGRRVDGYMTPGGQEEDASELDLDIQDPDSYCGQKPWEETKPLSRKCFVLSY
ncbi:MAG: AAA family ATPase [Synechococcaceae cyanobacterium SM2_3_1]|nr:AAA family ATPase [Synechococcaceae cyanobacterium SM2_3_1]